MGHVQGRKRRDCPGYRLRRTVGAGQRRPPPPQRGREKPPGGLQPRKPPDRQALLHSLRHPLLPAGIQGQGGQPQQQVGLLRENQQWQGFLRFLSHLRKRNHPPAFRRVPGHPRHVRRHAGGIRADVPLHDLRRQPGKEDAGGPGGHRNGSQKEKQAAGAGGHGQYYQRGF